MTFPLVTARLIIAPLGAADRDAFVAYRRVPEVARWQGWAPSYSEADADELIAAQPRLIESGSGRWTQLGVHHSGTLIGDLAVHALESQPDTYELGVTVAPAWQGAGFALEALGALTDHLFTAQAAHRVFAVTDARNQPAARLFQRLGFRHEGRNLKADWFKGEWTSTDTWAMLRSEATSA